MRRVLIFFYLPCVLLDLADDGGLGRVKFVNLHPVRPAVTESTLSLGKKIPASSGKVHHTVWWLPPRVAALLRRSASQPTAMGAALALKRVKVSRLGSANLHLGQDPASFAGEISL
jgi:hypothetical protein